MNYLLTLRKKRDVFWGEFVNDFVSAVRYSVIIVNFNKCIPNVRQPWNESFCEFFFQI